MRLMFHRAAGGFGLYDHFCNGIHGFLVLNEGYIQVKISGSGSIR